MKKISKKLSLNRETLATLSPELLDAIAGGQAQQSAATGVTRTITTTATPVSAPMSRITVCPSRVLCPPTLQCSIGGAGKGQE